MRLVKLECPNCGASLNVDKDKKEFYCKYCRTTSLLDDGVIRVEHTIVDENSGERLKLFKGLGITTMVYVGIILFVVIAVFGFIIFNVINMNSRVNEQKDNVMNQVNEVTNEVLDKVYTKGELSYFNSSFEMYSGTKSKFLISSLLDNVVTNNKTEKEHIITVVYRDNSTDVPDEIVKIKHSLNDDKKYEVSLDYDEYGFVYKVTITDL